VISENSVIPINSPTYYPPYNGAIEHEQLLVKRELLRRVISLWFALPLLILSPIFFSIG
jgi:hypothetical protein